MSHLKVLFGAQASVLRTRQFKLLLLGNVNAALGTVLVSPLLDSLTGPFAVSDVRIGLLMTAFTAPSVVGIPVVGMVSDRVGRKAVLVSGLLLFGLSGTAIALTTDFGPMTGPNLAIRYSLLLVGIGGAVVGVVAMLAARAAAAVTGP